MFETMASFMLVGHANGAMFDPPLGPAIYPRTAAPNRRPYRTSDGHIAVLIHNDWHWSAFVNAVQPSWAGGLGAYAAQGLAWSQFSCRTRSCRAAAYSGCRRAVSAADGVCPHLN